jgi:subtilisin family serine protease/subtilisin-like proprotein convertase family protein
MLWRRLIWPVLGCLLLAVLWRFSDTSPRVSIVPVPASRDPHAPAQPGSGAVPLDHSTGSYPVRVSNTSELLATLIYRETAILLENAQLDSGLPLELAIPSILKAKGEPGAYLVQSRGPATEAFQSVLRQADAVPVSYVPNNTYLVRASAQAAENLSRIPGVQAVLRYEPFFKLKAPLLELALQPLPAAGSHGEVSERLEIRALLFAAARQATLADVAALPLDVIAEESSPFGPVLNLRISPDLLVGLANLPGIQEIEVVSQRAPANDLSRSAIGVTADPATPANYLGLTGKGIVVNVTDSGVDATQPELAGRVSFDAAPAGTDTNGHGTHVAGIIAGSGAQSHTVTNASGSGSPPVNLQYRGQAPQAEIFSVFTDVTTGPQQGNERLVQTAARSNVFISNNSWVYAGDYGYDLAAARYDAAVRDALPQVSGSQPLLLVFPAGNSGSGNDQGFGGAAGTVQSPGTAKNVLTIGAVEHPRFITNETWTCVGTSCQTNRPWLGLTDSSNQVAGFSSRGNVGIGLEGPFGRFKPDVVAPGVFILSARSGQWDQGAYYADTNNLFCSDPDANCAVVLSNLNSSLGPAYRYESGTSLAAANVSGVFALMQEFFQARLHRTNSPALMKALLINGARSLGGPYDLQVQSTTNLQGWGLVHLPNSLPGALTNAGASSAPMFLIDQDPTQSLATGESQTRFVSLSGPARSVPLRVTLAWTDPPGNPLAGVKLVNDLNLVLTNLDTGEVFFGNHFAAGANFTSAWEPGTAPNVDVVNNVENVYLSGPLGSNYSITVVAHRVTVNAVTLAPENAVQDYALVIASGDGQLSDALTLTQAPPASFGPRPVSSIAATPLNGGAAIGAVLVHQRAGANDPLTATSTIPLPQAPGARLTLGVTNQWHFYAFTNESGFNNLAFLTGDALALSPITGWNGGLPAADLDLYVSTDPGLASLDPNVLAGADNSIGRGGTETVVYTNALPGIYYVGVKCESQDGADYSFTAIASAMPFAQTDGAGNELVQGFPAPGVVPGGTSVQPGFTRVFGIAPEPLPVRRVIVTNTVTADPFAALAGTLLHLTNSVVLNNFRSGAAVNDQVYIYDDSQENDVPGAQPSDGPGSLLDFAGGQGFGQWWFDLVDTNRPATNNDLQIFLEQQPPLNAGVTAVVLPGACRQDYIYLPLTTTNLTAVVSFVSGTGPLSMQVCAGVGTYTNDVKLILPTVGTNGTIVLDSSSHPPLNPGSYVVRVCNLGPDEAEVSIAATPGLNTVPPPAVRFTNQDPLAIPDDALCASTVTVTNTGQILSAEVGVRINHPRISDLALTLVSPNGTRVLLQENRGGESPDLGCSVFTTNTVPVSYRGGPEAVTNIIETGKNSGVITIIRDFYSLPDTMHLYYDGQLLFDSGLVSGAGTNDLSYGPGLSTSFTVVMNEGGNANSNTAWFFSLTSARLEPVFFTFTEDTNLASIPIKFAPAPLTNFNYAGSSYLTTKGIFYLPEQSLAQLYAEPASGLWTLEILDRRAGAINPPPTLLGWELALRFRDLVPAPLPLTGGVPVTNLLAGGEVQWFAVDPPAWVSFATNTLLSATAPVRLWFNSAAPPTGTNSGDVLLLAGVSTGVRVLQTNGLPPLQPGTRYYLGVQNTNAEAVSFATQIDFDVANVVTLQNASPYASTNLGPANATDYYRFVVSSNAVRAQFEINNPTANLLLFASHNPPLPGPGRFDYSSTNVWTNDQIIVIYDYSAPVPLSPGEWFLGVLSPTGVPAQYSVMATEFPVSGTNLLITSQTVTSSNVCLTWTSLPGAHYYVEGLTTLSDTNWVALSPTLTPNDVIASFCLDLPSSFAFFRVQEGLVLIPPPLLISAITYAPGGILLQWSAAADAHFTVQWSPSLSPAQWTSFPNAVSSSTGEFSFLDDGSQTGGIRAPRYYRLLQTQ